MSINASLLFFFCSSVGVIRDPQVLEVTVPICKFRMFFFHFFLIFFSLCVPILFLFLPFFRFFLFGVKRIPFFVMFRDVCNREIMKCLCVILFYQFSYRNIFSKISLLLYIKNCIFVIYVCSAFIFYFVCVYILFK